MFVPDKRWNLSYVYALMDDKGNVYTLISDKVQYSCSVNSLLKHWDTRDVNLSHEKSGRWGMADIEVTHLGLNRPQIIFPVLNFLGAAGNFLGDSTSIPSRVQSVHHISSKHRLTAATWSHQITQERERRMEFEASHIIHPHPCSINSLL